MIACGWCGRTLTGTEELCPGCGHRTGTTPSGGPTGGVGAPPSPWTTPAGAAWSPPARSPTGLIVTIGVILLVLFLLAGAAVWGVINASGQSTSSPFAPVGGPIGPGTTTSDDPPPVVWSGGTEPSVGAATIDGATRSVDIAGIQAGWVAVTDETIVVPFEFSLVGLDRADLSQRWSEPCEFSGWVDWHPTGLGDAVLVQCYDPNTRLRTRMVDTTTGATLWAAPLPLHGAAEGQVTDEVVATANDGMVEVWDMADGALLWSRAASAPDGAQPLAASEAGVFVNTGQAIEAHDPRTGGITWEAQVSPLSMAEAEDALVVWSRDGTLTRFEAETGVSVWDASPEVTSIDETHIASVNDSVVLLSVEDSSTIVAVDLATGTTLWSSEVQLTPPLLGDDVVVTAISERGFSHTELTDDRTGEQVRIIVGASIPYPAGDEVVWVTEPDADGVFQLAIEPARP